MTKNNFLTLLQDYHRASGQGVSVNAFIHRRYIMQIRPCIYNDIGQLRSKIEPLYNAVRLDGVFCSNGHDQINIPNGDHTKISFYSDLWGEIDKTDQYLCIMFDGIEQAKKLKQDILNATSLRASDIKWFCMQLDDENMIQLSKRHRPCLISQYRR